MKKLQEVVSLDMHMRESRKQKAEYAIKLLAKYFDDEIHPSEWEPVMTMIQSYMDRAIKFQKPPTK